MLSVIRTGRNCVSPNTCFGFIQWLTQIMNWLYISACVCVCIDISMFTSGFRAKFTVPLQKVIQPPSRSYILLISRYWFSILFYIWSRFLQFFHLVFLCLFISCVKSLLLGKWCKCACAFVCICVYPQKYLHAPLCYSVLSLWTSASAKE